MKYASFSTFRPMRRTSRQAHQGIYHNLMGARAPNSFCHIHLPYGTQSGLIFGARLATAVQQMRARSGGAVKSKLQPAIAKQVGEFYWQSLLFHNAIPQAEYNPNKSKTAFGEKKHGVVQDSIPNVVRLRHFLVFQIFSTTPSYTL